MNYGKCLLAWSFAVSGVVAPLAHADEWGCQVLLCLSNPKGPTDEKACKPPIEKLWQELAKPNGQFPHCDLAKGPNGSNSWAQPTSNYYDACPAGTTALADGAEATTPNLGGTVTGIGDGEGVYPYSGDMRMGGANQTAMKVCVSGFQGRKWVMNNNTWPATGSMVNVYQNVVELKPNGSPKMIEVFIDSQLYRQVRY